MEVKLRRVVLMRPLFVQKLSCVVLTFGCLEICLCVVLELTPQELTRKSEVSKETEQKTA